MFPIDYSPQAQRTLGTLPAPTRKLINQMVNAVAEMAELFPDKPAVWRRLGRVEQNRVEIAVERREICVELEGGAVRVLSIEGSGRTGSRRHRGEAARRSR